MVEHFPAPNQINAGVLYGYRLGHAELKPHKLAQLRFRRGGIMQRLIREFDVSRDRIDSMHCEVEPFRQLYGILPFSAAQV